MDQASERPADLVGDGSASRAGSCSYPRDTDDDDIERFAICGGGMPCGKVHIALRSLHLHSNLRRKRLARVVTCDDEKSKYLLRACETLIFSRFTILEATELTSSSVCAPLKEVDVCITHLAERLCHQASEIKQSRS